MAREVEFGDGGAGKVRSFGAGVFFAVITLGIYYFFWYYFVNDELKDIGVARGDKKLGDSRPGRSLAAVLFNPFGVGIPALVSVYNYGGRIRRAEKLVGVPASDQISVGLAFWTLFFGFLLVPALFHFWYVTKHQNQAVVAAGENAATAVNQAVAVAPMPA